MKRTNATYAQLMPSESHPYPHMPVLWHLPYDFRTYISARHRPKTRRGGGLWWKTMQHFEPMETWHIGSSHLRTNSAPDSPLYSLCPCPAPIYAIVFFFVAAQSWQTRATRGKDAHRTRTQEGRNFLENWTFALRWKSGPLWMSLLSSEDQVISASKAKTLPHLGVTGLTCSWETWVLRKNMEIRSCQMR